MDRLHCYSTTDDTKIYSFLEFDHCTKMITIRNWNYFAAEQCIVHLPDKILLRGQNDDIF